jgi:hypothetical protein
MPDRPTVRTLPGARALLLAALLPAVVALGACGGGDEDSSPTTTASAGGDATSTTAADTGDTGGASDAGAGGDFCDRVNALDDTDPSGNGEEIAAAYEEIRSVAPAEVTDDLDVMIEYFNNQALSGNPTPEALERLATLGQEYAEASGNLVSYVNSNC